jgi:hypothetical protein
MRNVFDNPKLTSACSRAIEVANDHQRIVSLKWTNREEPTGEDVFFHSAVDNRNIGVTSHDDLFIPVVEFWDERSIQTEIILLNVVVERRHVVLVGQNFLVHLCSPGQVSRDTFHPRKPRLTCAD